MEGLGRKLAIEAQYLSIKRHMGRRVAAQSPFFSFSRTFQICLTRQKEKWQHGSTQVFKTTFILTWSFFMYYLLSELYSELEAFNQLHKFKKLTQNMWRWGGGGGCPPVLLLACSNIQNYWNSLCLACTAEIAESHCWFSSNDPSVFFLFYVII